MRVSVHGCCEGDDVDHVFQRLVGLQCERFSGLPSRSLLAVRVLPSEAGCELRVLETWGKDFDVLCVGDLLAEY